MKMKKIYKNGKINIEMYFIKADILKIKLKLRLFNKPQFAQVNVTSPYN